MSFFSILKAGITAMIDDAQKPESHKIGDAFEKYVREFLFIQDYYTLLEKTHDYQTNKGDYVQSSLKPDYTFQDHYTNGVFFVEAKFRTDLYIDKYVWCNQNQLARYNECNKHYPVFIILGFGDDPSSPDALALLPLSKAKYTGLYPSYLERFKIELDRPITSKILWNR
ncbi:hypothetical protein [Mucilaginibacter sp.]|uniref:hypothetical protein n=1 Tax=Mucilaginibacter sp. TaxID=1882438 RepID=UPI003D101025